MITFQAFPLQLTGGFPLLLLRKSVFLVNADGVMRARTEVVDAVLMVIIKFRKLFGDELDWQEVELKRKRDGLSIEIWPMLVGKVLEKGGESDLIFAFG